jgi:hypothetical protein
MRILVLQDERFERLGPAGELAIPVARRTIRRERPLRFLLFRAWDYRPSPQEASYGAR